MLAKDALEKAQSIQDAEFWKERAEWLAHIASAASLGHKYVKLNKRISTNVKVALELMGYKVTIIRRDYMSGVYTEVDWS